MYEDVHKSTINHNEKQNKTPSSSIEEWINQWWYIHTMKYHPAMRLNKQLLHSATWVNLTNIG